MSANNRIGIKVNVEFPTITELRDSLKEKVNKAIDGAEFHKIKLDVNESHMKSVRKKINDLLTKDAYEIKINTKDAISSVDRLNKRIAEIDQELKGTRKLRVNLDVVNLNSSLKDLMGSMTKMQDEAKTALNKGMKGFADELDKVDNRMNSISKKFKLNREGNVASATITDTKKDNLGRTEKTTFREDAKGMTAEVEYLHSKDKALQSVKKQMKDVFEIEQAMSKAKHDNDEALYERLEQERKQLNKELSSMHSDYKTTYGESYNIEDDIKKLREKQDLERDILKIRQQQDNAKKAEKAEEERLQQIQREQTAFEKEIAQAVSKVAQMEQKRFDIKKQLQSATGNEKKALQDQLTYYNKIVAQLYSQHDLQGYMNNEQREALKSQREVHKLVLATTEAKAKDKQLSQEQKAIAKQLESELKEVLKIQEKIAMVKEQQHKDGSQTQLRILQQELDYAKAQQSASMEKYEAEGKVTNEMREQLSNITRLSAEQENLIANEARMVREQEEINAKYKELKTIMSSIDQLNRDLIFSGQRESQYINRALREQQEKANILRQEVMNSELVTAERKREIEQIEKAQAEQRQLNQLRAQARETDREFNIAGGVADYYSVFSNYKQAFNEILIEVKEVDEAFMKIKKVAEATDETLQEFKDTSYDLASSLGVTAVDYMTAVEKWVTAGYSLNKSEELAKISTIGSFVGNIGTDDMAKWLSVPLNAYKNDLLEANDIINIMNETSNNHAVEMEELGKAYMRSASSVTSAGVTFSELTGFITAAQEATRIGGERIGTSLKAISSNYGSIKSQLTGQQQTKHDWFENTLGISLDETESMTEAFGQLAEKWKTMTDVQKNTATFYLAGKEHQNIITAIMNEWDTYQSALSDADFQLGLGENGSAYKEFQQQKDSVRFQLAEVKNAWTELMNTIGNSNGMVKNVLSAVTEGLQKINDIAQNEKLMDLLQLVLIGVGLHAGHNGVMRALDLMGQGLRNIHSNAKETKRALTELFSSGSNVANNPTVIAGLGNGRNNDNDNNSNRNNNNNNRDNDSTVVATTRTERNRNRNRRSNTNNTGNSGDTTSQETERTRRSMSELGEETARTSSKLSNMGKVAKGALSFVPLLGDALLVAELLGVDVFGTIGKAFDNMSESSDEYLEKIKKTKEELKDNSMLSNGEMKNLLNEVNNETNGYRARVESVRKDDENGQLSAEEFEKLKEEFNLRIEELGFDADIKITWNDYEEIMDKITKYEEALNGLNDEETKEFANKGISVLNDSDTGMKEALEEYQLYIEKQKLANEELEKYKKLQQGAKNAGNDKIADNLGEYVEKYQKRVEELGEKAEEAKTKYSELGLAFLDVSDAMSKLSSDDVADILGNITDTEQLTKIVAGLVKTYEDASEKLGTYKQAQENLSKGNDLTKDEFKEIIGLLSEVDESYQSVSYQDYVDNTGNVRDTIKQVIDNLTLQQQEQTETANNAMNAGIEISASMGVTGEAISNVSTEAQQLKKDIENVPTSKTVEFKAKVSEYFRELWSNVKSGVSNVVKFVAGGDKSESVSSVSTSNSISSTPKAQGLVSANVSTGDMDNPLVSLATSSTGTGSTSTRSSSSTSSNANAKVSQDIWRYWRTEDKLDALTNAMSDLEREISLAGEDYKKVGQLLQKELNNLQSQQSVLTTYKNAKTHEAQQRLQQLTAYGFKVDKKNLTISNLESQSMKLTGDKATEAEELLNAWHSLVSEIGSIDQQLKDIATSTKDIQDAIKENNISKELQAYEKFLESVEKTLKTIDNRNSINSSFMSLIDENDYELLLKMNEKMANDSVKAVEDLSEKFSKLSLSTIVNKENAEEFLGTLEELRDEILSNADSIIEYTKAVNDMEIQRVTSDLSEMTDAVSDLQDKLSNTRDNISEGLLSGTTLDDLQSTQLNKLDLSRKNQLDKMAQDRINLEQKLQEALDGFAVKNIDRTAKVANETLRINTEMYKQLLTVADEYNSGKGISNFTNILADLSKITSQKATDDDYGLDKELEKLYNEMYKKQSELNAKYADKLASENYDTRLQAEYEYTVESLGLQKMMLEESIKTSKLAIEEYKKQLSDENLTQSQIKEIEDLIEEEEQAIIDAQNSIKDSISELYEFQFSKIDELIGKYDEMASALEYSQSIIEAINPNDLNASWKISEAIRDNLLNRKQALNDIIASMEHEMSLQQQGSYEWKILNSELSEYKQMLQDANLSLIEMNKQMASLRLDNVLGQFEKKLFDGKTMEQFKDFKDLWLTGLEREIALEELYDKIAEIGTDAFDEKMELLDKQEKVSRLEMDYLAKQLEIIEMQKQLEDSKGQRTVKTLQQNADGTFDWNYVADEEDSKELSNSIKQAQLELLEMEDSAKESYLGKLENIIAGIQNGDYENKEQLKESLDDLSSAYSVILGDIPASLGKLSSEILYAYEQMQLGNSDILDELTNRGDATPTISTIDKLGSDIVTELKNLGDKLESAIMNALLNNTNSRSVSPYQSHNVSTAQSQAQASSISIASVEFPNVTSSDEIKDAILNLPSYALQYAKKK